MQIGRALDPTLNLKRVVFSPDEFREAVYKAKKGECIIYDEAFTGFSSRSSLGVINRVLVSLSMQMRQKNLFVIIVLPTIFLLDKYIALFRAKALIHVYESKGRRGYFRIYNYKLKKLLILLGQKTFSYQNKLVRTNFRGRFYGKFALGEEKIEEDYRKRKDKALRESEKSPMTSQQVKFKEQRDLMLYLLRNRTGMSYREISSVLDEYDMTLSYVQIRSICGKFGDIEKLEDKSIDSKEIIKEEKQDDEIFE